jgi:hypothetical protein
MANTPEFAQHPKLTKPDVETPSDKSGCSTTPEELRRVKPEGLKHLTFDPIPPDSLTKEIWSAMVYYERFLRKTHPELDDVTLERKAFTAVQFVEFREALVESANLDTYLQNLELSHS